jgi:hypothetical protein
MVTAGAVLPVRASLPPSTGAAVPPPPAFAPDVPPVPLQHVVCTARSPALVSAAMTEASSPPPPAPPEPPPLEGLLRAFKFFLFPFLFSWVLAYVGSNRNLEWVYFTGLAGVGVSMLGLMVWLIR